MCTKPSRPGTRFTNAPKVVVFTTVPSYVSPDQDGTRVRDLVDHASGLVGPLAPRASR